MTVTDRGLDPSLGKIGCRFCVEPHGHAAEEMHELPFGSRAVATVGALVPFWCLVLAPRHVPSTAWLSDDERGALFGDVESLATLLPGGKTFVFEHGASDEGSPTACTTAHAHVHVVAISHDLIGYADEHLPLPGNWEPVKIEQIGEFSGRDYLLAGGPGDLQIRLLQEPISQYFRMVIAHWTGDPSGWDWHLDTRPDEYRQTQNLLSNLAS